METFVRREDPEKQTWIFYATFDEEYTVVEEDDRVGEWGNYSKPEET